jgi:NTE family protein
MPDRPTTALVLSGGGARGAYQVGVLRGLVEEGFLPRGRSGIDVFVGSSAGAINSTFLAAHAGEFDAGLARLEGIWGGLSPSKVYRTDAASLGRIGARWIWDLSLGGITRGAQPRSLLDTGPLRELLGAALPFARIEAHLAEGALRALALSATDLVTSNGVVFLDARDGAPLWTRRRWRVERARIGLDHVMASSAIPILFPPVLVEGRYLADGSIRNTTPLSPAINLGAERVIAIGVSGPPPEGPLPAPHGPPSIAQIAGVLLDAVMLDAIEVDVEHSERVNASVLRCPGADPGNPFRRVDVLWLRPSALVRRIAAEHARLVPSIVRYLLRGLGSDEAVTELVSYLLFDARFCGRLMELGREDVVAERASIERFFTRPDRA